MSDKDENCLTFVLKWSFIIILFTTVFLLGFSFIYYSQISLDSKISSFFSFLSSLGILATIGVYFWQKNDSKRKQHEYEKNFFSDIKKAAKEFIITSEKYKKAFEEILRNYNKMHDSIVISKGEYSILLIKVERYGVLQNLEYITNCQPVLNLEKTRMDPALLSSEACDFYNESKLTLEGVESFIKWFILDNTNGLSTPIPIDDKMNFYLEKVYHEHVTNLRKIVNILQ
ncbi:TPA: hypothetical protein ACKRII_002964 [Proteus mirabilis]